MNTRQRFPRKTVWGVLSILIIGGSLIWQFGVGAQSRRANVAPKMQDKMQQGSSRTARSTVGRTTAQSAIQSARARVDQAIANEKANPTKQAALDVDATWLELNNANAARVAEIQMNLRSLESSAKTSANAAQMESLETE